MTQWLLDHEAVIQTAAGLTLLAFVLIWGWWTRGSSALADLGSMSAQWLRDKNIWRR